MTWLAPRTWLLNESVDAGNLNIYLKDNLIALRNLNDNAIRVHRTAVQSLTNNARTAISWQATTYQTGIGWSSGTNPTRLTVSVSGMYLLVANIPFANVGGGRRGVGWRANGGATAWDMQLHPANGVDTANAVELIDLVAGDYIEVYAYQNSGGALNTAGTTEGNVWAALSLFATGPDGLAPWVPTKTWVSGDILSPSLLNTHIRDQTLSLRNFKGAGAKCWISEDQSISQAQRTALTWDRSTRNVGGIWDGSSKFIAPVDGIYMLQADIEWADLGSAGVMGIGYRINNDATANDLQFQEGTGNGEVQSGGDLIQLFAGDFVEFYAFQDSPESISIHGGTEDRSRVSVVLWAGFT